MPKKIKADDMKMQEHWGKHKKMMAWKMLVLGLLVLANAKWEVVSWASFIGIILAIAGLAKLVMPYKSCK